MPHASRRPLLAGNWKMNGLRASVSELAKIIDGARGITAVDLLVCPPATLLAEFAAVARNSPLRIGAQDCHAEPAGAFTGDISAEMLKDAGASAVILGHSERRIQHHESDAQIRAKVLAAWRAGLLAIICVGETRAQRDNAEVFHIVGNQVAESIPDGSNGKNTVVAYEPVWAIGSGLTAMPKDIAEMHGFVRARLRSRFGQAGEETRILYGGSVRSSNARELLALADVDGALVGGASLKAEEFLAIARAYS
jgi:triosephosphate isomerase (TIM)